jgi:hypothetical protein
MQSNVLCEWGLVKTNITLTCTFSNYKKFSSTRQQVSSRRLYSPQAPPPLNIQELPGRSADSLFPVPVAPVMLVDLRMSAAAATEHELLSLAVDCSRASHYIHL